MGIFTAIGSFLGAVGGVAGTVTTASILGVQVVVTIASTAYQMIQSNKARKAAEAAAEARKGFEIVSEGSVTNVPIVYGKAKIGGNRVYSKVIDYEKDTSNADKSILTRVPDIDWQV